MVPRVVMHVHVPPLRLRTRSPMGPTKAEGDADARARIAGDKIPPSRGTINKARARRLPWLGPVPARPGSATSTAPTVRDACPGCLFAVQRFRSLGHHVMVEMRCLDKQFLLFSNEKLF
jgi:hypothetical protein